MEFEAPYPIDPVGAATRRPRSSMSRIRLHLGEMVTLYRRAADSRPYIHAVTSCVKFQFVRQDTLTLFLRLPMAPFSRRLTWAWEIPRVDATSIWVFPS